MLIQDELNCICEFIIECFDEAKKLDISYKNNNNKPPLFGIPFSVKENFHVINFFFFFINYILQNYFKVEGYNSTIGMVNNLNNLKTDDCTFVKQLKNQGAIPFVITNVPQGLLSYVCSNPIYGTTSNPFNLTR